MRTIALTVALLLAATAAPAQEYQIDKTHSGLLFGIQHLGLGYTYGWITDFDGSIEFDRSNPQQGSVSLTAQVASIDTHNKKRDDHLRNADFFDAGTHPKITFTGNGFAPVEGEADTYHVTGDLTIRGTTQEITVPVTLTGMGSHPMAKKPAIGFHSEFTIDRTKFGVGQGDISKAVGEDVKLIIALEAIAE